MRPGRDHREGADELDRPPSTNSVAAATCFLDVHATAAPSGWWDRHTPVRGGDDRSPPPTAAHGVDTRCGGADDQAVLHAALKTGPVHEFAVRKPSLTELFREVVFRVSERSGLNPSRAIATGARREFLTQVQKKSFLVSNVIVLIAIIGGIVAASIFSGKTDDESRSKVGLVGDQSLSAALVATGDAAGNPVEVTEIGDEQSRPPARRSRTATSTSPSCRAAGARSPRSRSPRSTPRCACRARRLRWPPRPRAPRWPPRASHAARNWPRTPRRQSSPSTPSILRIPNVDSASRCPRRWWVLLYMQILAFGMYVAMGVVEEKVVPRRRTAAVDPASAAVALWGKVIGIGAVGLAQLTVYGVVGVGAGVATGVLTLGGTPGAPCSARWAGSFSASRSSRCSMPQQVRWSRVRRTSTPPRCR